MAGSFRARRRRIAWTFAAAVCAAPAFADVVDVTWLGGSGSWQTPSLWSGGVVPDNSGTSSYDVSIPAGTVTSEKFSIAIDSLRLDAPAMLSMAPYYPNQFAVNGPVELNGTLLISTGRMVLGPSASFSGSGTVNIGGDYGDGSLKGSDRLEIPAGLNVEIRGSLVAQLGSNDKPFVNRGYIFGGARGDNNRPIVSGSTFNNLGTIEARQGAISFGGTFTRADLGDLVWNQGTFGVGSGGTLVNQNQTLLIDAAHPWELDGGTIQGGTIQIAPDTALRTIFPANDIAGYSGTLDNVIVNGRIEHGGAGSLNISNGLLQGNAEIVLGPGGIPGPPRVVTTNSSLTIASTAFVHGAGNGGFPMLGVFGCGVGDGSSAIVNHGTIQADPGSREFDILGTSITNDGRLAVNSEGLMYVGMSPDIGGSLRFESGGVLQIAMSYAGIGLLDVNGTLDLSTASDSLILSADSVVQRFTYYRIATASGGIIGEFDSVAPGFQIQYTANDIFARVVPEPSTTFMAIALWTLCVRRRNRCDGA